jgi:hypothetical protein
MSLTPISLSAASTVLMMLATVGFAEVRGRPYTTEQLHEQSTWVIQGAVREIATVEEFRVSFPVRASVETVVKGRWTEREITFRHKHPGLHAIFAEEFSKPEMGQTGIFYVQSRNGASLLIGYISDVAPDREFAVWSPSPDLKPPTAGEERRAFEIGEIAREWWLKNRGLLAEESFKVAGSFSAARPISKFAARDDRLWEVRVLHLHTGSPTGILWINDRTGRVLALGANEK